jgi:hypothetical protein
VIVNIDNHDAILSRKVACYYQRAAARGKTEAALEHGGGWSDEFNPLYFIAPSFKSPT